MQYSINQFPATAPEAFYNLKNVLSSSGWLVVSSSDGTTALDGDYWAIASASNNYSWVLLNSPDNTRWITLQRGTGNQYWRVKYLSGSYNADGTATTTPTPITGGETNPEFVAVGAGTDASPQFSTFFNTDNTYRMHAVAHDTAPYGWWFGTFNSSDANPQCILSVDPLTGTLAGDPDPTIVHASSNWHVGYPFHGTYGMSVVSYCGAGIYSGSSWVRIPAGIIRSANSDPMNNSSTNTTSGKYDSFPFHYLRSNSEGSPYGYKGISTLFVWLPGNVFSRGDIIGLPSTGSHVILSPSNAWAFAGPWQPGTDFMF